MSDSNHIFRVRQGHVTVGGNTYPVSSMDFRLDHNGIPRITLGIDSAHPGEGSGGDTEVSRADFSSLLDNYSSLSSSTLLRDATRGSFHLELDRGTAAFQSLELEDWILTDVGLGNFTFGSMTQPNVTLSHPAAILQDGSIRVLGKAEAKNVPSNPPDNVIEGISAFLEYAGGLELSEGLSEASEKAVSRTGEMAGLVNAHLNWVGESGWPNVGGAMQDHIHKGLFTDLLGMNSMSPWEAISNRLASLWDFHIIPTYEDEKLLVEPYNPWRSPEASINSNNVEESAVKAEGGRIAGVIAIDSTIERMVSSSARWEAGDEEILTSEEGYFERELSGSIMKIRNLPAYAEAARHGAIRNEYASSSYLDSVEREYRQTGSTVVAQSAVPFGYGSGTRSFLRRFCKQKFCNAFMSDRSIYIQLPFNLETGAVPGRTMSLSTGTSDIKFLVTSVRHMLDSNSGMAETLIQGSYAHTDEQINSVSAVLDGVNHIYT